MDINHPKTKGIISEQFIIANLLNLGYDVSVPVGDNLKYDLIVDCNNRLYRVQCKSGRLRNGSIKATLVSARMNTKGMYKTWLAVDEVDFIAVYCTNNVYIVPIAEVVGQSQINLRIEPTKSNQQIGIRWAKDYILNENSFA